MEIANIRIFLDYWQHIRARTVRVAERIPPDHIDQIAPLNTQWYSLGTIHVDDGGHGVLVYEKGDDLYGKGLNMIMMFGNQSAGSHEGPEDLGELMAECNGPIPGTHGIAPMELRVLEGEITVRPD